MEQGKPEKKQRGRKPNTPRINRLEHYLMANEARYECKLNNTIIDLEQVCAMASIGCTIPEIATLLRVSNHWVDNEIADNPHFKLAIEVGRAEMKRSLRRTQLEVAHSGNPSMLIWLGKQYLDQRDKQDVNTTHTEVNILVSNCLNQLDNIPKNALLEARAALRPVTLDNDDNKNISDTECDYIEPPMDGGGIE